MKYAGIVKNDVVNCPGVAVSIYLQGCPIHCAGCHNSELWDFNGGKEFNPEIMYAIEDALTANGIKRALCILGGEPLCFENLFLTAFIIQQIRQDLPDTVIYLWTGYKLEDLQKSDDIYVHQILNEIDYLIDGPFIAAERDVSLFMRGSKNQIVWDMTNNEPKKIDIPENLCYDKRKKGEKI